MYTPFLSGIARKEFDLPKLKSIYGLTVYFIYCAQKLKSYSANDFEFFFDFWVVPSKMSVNDAD